MRRFRVLARVFLRFQLRTGRGQVVVTQVRVVLTVVAGQRRQQPRRRAERCAEADTGHVVRHHVAGVTGFERKRAPLTRHRFDRQISDRLRKRARRRGPLSFFHRRTKTAWRNVPDPRAHISCIISRLHLRHHHRINHKRLRQRHRLPRTAKHAPDRRTRIHRAHFQQRSVRQLPDARLQHEIRYLFRRMRPVLIRRLLQLHRKPIRLHIRDPRDCRLRPRV